METRNIKITLEKAIEWYNSDNNTLKDIALQAFSKEELTAFDFTKIKTFEDALAILQYSKYEKIHITEAINSIPMYSKASAAMCKLNIIRKALNLGQDLDLVKESHIYYPYNPFITDNSNYYNKDSDLKETVIIGAIKNKEKTYRVLGNKCNLGSSKGLSSFYPKEGIGLASPSIAILGCATEEIAKHFSKYFGMLITEAKYGDLPDFEIVDSINCKYI